MTAWLTNEELLAVKLWYDDAGVDLLRSALAELHARRAGDMSHTGACDLVEARKFAAIILGTSQYTEGFKNLAAALVLLNDALRVAREGERLSEEEWARLAAIRADLREFGMFDESKGDEMDGAKLDQHLAVLDKILARGTRP